MPRRLKLPDEGTFRYWNSEAHRKQSCGHEVAFARQVGWHRLTNGELIQQAEDVGYQVLLSTDKNIRYQQNLASRNIALVILGTSQWSVVQLHLEKIVGAVDSCTRAAMSR